MPIPPAPSVALITLSFRGDLELCRLLCDSVDRHVPEAVRHSLVVPRADLALFASLAGPRRAVVAEETLLPPWLLKLPLPGPRWRKRLFLPRRNIHLSLKGGLVRGWIVQQVIKLAAAAAARTDAVLMVDSDVAFVRRFDPAALLIDGRIRLHRRPGAEDTAMHRPWHMAACALLGLQPAGYQGADYIDNLVPWRPEIVRRLLQRIAATSGRHWVDAVTRQRHFSEYICYGIHCDKVLGIAAAGHAGTPDSLCATVWSEAAAAELAGRSRPVLAAGQVAIGVQSTLALPMAARARMIDLATREAPA
jgi:hypothetical protein